jgi:hypothetical protein
MTTYPGFPARRRKAAYLRSGASSAEPSRWPWGTVLLLRAGIPVLLVSFFTPGYGVAAALTRSAFSPGVPPHDGVRSAGVGSTRSLRSADHSRNGAPAIAVTSSWQELLSAQPRRNLSGSDQEAAASLFDQRNSVPSRHMRWRMTASLRATATVAFLWPIFRASRVPHAFSVDQPGSG